MNHISPLEILRRFDRYELADNRMTVFAPSFGLGSVHYWDGSWDNDEDEIPWQSREALENRDGELEVVFPGGYRDILRKDDHVWYPHRIEARYIGSRNNVWYETKAIDGDVAVSKMRVVGHGLRRHSVILTHGIGLQSGLSVEAVSGGVHVISAGGHYSGIHRFIGVAGAVSEPGLNRRSSDVLLEAEIEITPECGREFALVVACGEDEAETQRRFEAALKNPQMVLDGAERRWRSYFENHVPAFACDNEEWTKLYYFSCYVLRANLYDFRKGAIQHPYSCPSKWRLMPSWFWDPCFHGFSEKWLRDYPAPLSTFRNHIGVQEGNGYLPMTVDTRGNTWKAMGAHAPEACQQFVHPMTVWDHYLVHGDRAVLQEMLEPLVRHDRYIAQHRETGGLFVPVSGGELADNSSRLVDDIGERDQIHKLGNSIQPIDWNTFQYIAERLLARMAREIGRSDLEREMTARAEDKLRALSSLWNPAIGLYSDGLLPAGRTSNKKIPEALCGLLGGFANREQTESTVSFLTDPGELWTEYPVPTLPLSDPLFIDEDVYASYWNGRVWPNMNWCYIEALCRAGCRRVATELLYKTLRMFVCTGEAHCMENFHPRAASRYSPPHCTLNQGWATAGVDLILRRGLGLQMNAAKREVSFDPLGLPGVTEFSVQGLPFAGGVLDVEGVLPGGGSGNGSLNPPALLVSGGSNIITSSAHWLEL